MDAPIWCFHASKQTTQAGSHPGLRTLYYKILKLLQNPITPLFVFDGPDKPKFKRGKRVTGGGWTGHEFNKITQDFKQMLDEMGLEYWVAPGEAEAELAHLSQTGRIDAVLSDDVDALMFGAKRVLRKSVHLGYESHRAFLTIKRSQPITKSDR